MRPRVTWSLWNLFLGTCRCTSPATWAVTSTTATCPTWSTLCRWHRTCLSGSTIAKVRFVRWLGAGYRWGYCHHGAILLLIRGKVRKGSSSPRVEYLLVRWVHHHPGAIHLLRRPKGLMSSSSSRWDWSVDEDGGCGGGGWRCAKGLSLTMWHHVTTPAISHRFLTIRSLSVSP